MLIHAVTGRDINSSMLPFDAGCIVQNVATVIAVYQAVCRSTPLITKVMTVTGDAVKNPCNLEVSIGCSHQSVLDAAGGFAEQPEKLISGGPMMGTAMFTLDIPVQKTSSSILAFRQDPVADNPVSNCIHCGRCVSACPERLVPTMLQDAADHDDFARFEKLGGMECIECGCCTIVCPAKRTLTQSCKYGKVSVNRLRREAKAKADAANASK
jgi:electron transport complex protein RnfC